MPEMHLPSNVISILEIQKNSIDDLICQAEIETENKHIDMKRGRQDEFRDWN